MDFNDAKYQKALENVRAMEIDKIINNKELLELFKKDPIKAVEQSLGKALPDEELKKIVDGVKAKLSIDKASGALDSLKKLF